MDGVTPVSLEWTLTLWFLGALTGSFFLTFLVQRSCTYFGFVHRPSADRWSSRVVSLGGGIALFSILAAGCLLHGFFYGGTALLSIVPAITLLFAAGLYDDIVGLSPLWKIIIQVLSASYLVSCGWVLPGPWPVFSIPLTVFAMVVISNSVNLIDNMDGFAAGIAFTVGLGAAFCFYQASDTPYMILAILFAGTCLGFLLHNLPPARIFMGDCGSLMLGLVCCLLGIRLRFQDPTVPEALSFVPMGMLLVVPLFDTLLVSVSRLSHDRSIFTGGRDHTSHRLVALGLTERRALAVLYGLSLIGGLVAFSVLNEGPENLLFWSAAFMVGVASFWSFLLRMRVYPGMNRLEDTKGSMPRILWYSIEILLDIGVISVAWIGAHYIRFQDSGLETYKVLAVIPLLPVMYGIKICVFALFGLYQGIWNRVMVEDVYRVFKAVSLSSLLSVLVVVLLNRLEGVSRVVLALDWTMTFIGVLGARTAFSAFGRWTRRLSSQDCQVGLVGSHELIAPLKRALERQKKVHFAGLILPDGSDKDFGAGVSVLGEVRDLPDLVRDKKLDLLLTLDFDTETIKKLQAAAPGLRVRNLEMQV